MTADRKFERLDAHLRESGLVRGADASARGWHAAAEQSAAVQSIRRARERFLFARFEDRVRTVAVFVATATIGHLFLLRLLPAHIAPALPQLFWIVTATAASVIALTANRVPEAWLTSVTGRLSRRALDLLR